MPINETFLKTYDWTDIAKYQTQQEDLEKAGVLIEILYDALHGHKMQLTEHEAQIMDDVTTTISAQYVHNKAISLLMKSALEN